MGGSQLRSGFRAEKTAGSKAKAQNKHNQGREESGEQRGGKTWGTVPSGCAPPAQVKGDEAQAQAGAVDQEKRDIHGGTLKSKFCRSGHKWNVVFKIKILKGKS